LGLARFFNRFSHVQCVYSGCTPRSNPEIVTSAIELWVSTVPFVCLIAIRGFTNDNNE
jgi:hypothetical protein